MATFGLTSPRAGVALLFPCMKKNRSDGRQKIKPEQSPIPPQIPRTPGCSGSPSRFRFCESSGSTAEKFIHFLDNLASSKSGTT